MIGGTVDTPAPVTSTGDVSIVLFATLSVFSFSIYLLLIDISGTGEQSDEDKVRRMVRTSPISILQAVIITVITTGVIIALRALIGGGLAVLAISVIPSQGVTIPIVIAAMYPPLDDALHRRSGLPSPSLTIIRGVAIGGLWVVGKSREEAVATVDELCTLLQAICQL